MKSFKKICDLIACFVIICCVWGCASEKIEQKEVIVDILLFSNPETTSLPEDLQNLFAPEMLLPDNNVTTIVVPTGKLSRADLAAPLELIVKYEKTTLEKMQEQLKKTNAEDMLNTIKNYLSGIDVSRLNSNEQIDNEDKNNRIKEFVQEQQGENSQYDDVLFYAENPQNDSWGDYSVNHDIGAIRELVFASISSNPKNKFLLIYNPPPLVIEEIIVFPEAITLDETSLVLEKAGETKRLNATIYPDNVSEMNRNVTWNSEDEKIATVDENGLVKAIARGNTNILANSGNGLTATCTVQVKIKNLPNNPTLKQLNDLLIKISKSDDSATDELRRVLGNGLRVEGATNISNVQQLITDVSNGSHYKVTRVNTDSNGKVVSINVGK